jgi:Zn-dependent protease/CBS domain-containing protein
LLHELGHAVAARAFALPIRGITLFIFGGVAEMEDEPPSPRAEFVVALAGPVVTVALFLLAWIAAQAIDAVARPAAVVLVHLAWANALLVVFNLVPAFPLDGGRVLRSILWAFTGDVARATRVCSRLGAAFGWLLLGLGLLGFLTGNFVAGLWTALIGYFLRNAAGLAYRQLLLKRALEGETIERFMMRNPVLVPASVSVQELVEDYLYRYQYETFPVVQGERLVGCVGPGQVRRVPRGDWGSTIVGTVAEPCSAENTISPRADAMKALTRMSRPGPHRLMVVEGDRLVGMVSVKDLLRLLALKLELGEAV